jgi:hypothetical protein
MRHFATESGKSKGQFYTPAEVSRIMAKVIGISPANSKASTTAYDPTCGSGSLLLCGNLTEAGYSNAEAGALQAEVEFYTDPVRRDFHSRNTEGRKERSPLRASARRQGDSGGSQWDASGGGPRLRDLKAGLDSGAAIETREPGP